MEEGDNLVTKLTSACHEAFCLYPKSCSHAVIHVIKQYNTKQLGALFALVILHLLLVV
jgi:hypothetical protein